jgi:hypothetical protein
MVADSLDVPYKRVISPGANPELEREEVTCSTSKNAYNEQGDSDPRTRILGKQVDHIAQLGLRAPSECITATNPAEGTGSEYDTKLLCQVNDECEPGQLTRESKGIQESCSDVHERPYRYRRDRS